MPILPPRHNRRREVTILLSCYRDHRFPSEYNTFLSLRHLAEHTGFEPANLFRPTVFKTAPSPPGHAPYNATGRCRSHSSFPTCSLSKRPPLPIGYCGTYRLRNSNPYLPAENRVSLPLDEGGIAGTAGNDPTHGASRAPVLPLHQIPIQPREELNFHSPGQSRVLCR